MAKILFYFAIMMTGIAFINQFPNTFISSQKLNLTLNGGNYTLAVAQAIFMALTLGFAILFFTLQGNTKLVAVGAVVEIAVNLMYHYDSFFTKAYSGIVLSVIFSLIIPLSNMAYSEYFRKNLYKVFPQLDSEDGDMLLTSPFFPEKKFTSKQALEGHISASIRLFNMDRQTRGLPKMTRHEYLRSANEYAEKYKDTQIVVEKTK